MIWEHNGQVLHRCAVVFRVKEEFGELSNMAGGFGLRVNGHRVWSSEALYQTCRFPRHPEIQAEIIRERSPMGAKMKAKKDGRREKLSRPDWEEVRVDVMYWCLQVKLAQNLGPFFWPLKSTGARPIVEKSRKDAFWGAIPDEDGILRGANQLGRLLVRLREAARARFDSARAALQVVEPPGIEDFLLLEEPISTVTG